MFIPITMDSHGKTGNGTSHSRCRSLLIFASRMSRRR